MRSPRLDGDGERQTILDQPEQYARLFETMDKMVAEGRLRAIVRAFVVLVAATGMRRNEARTQPTHCSSRCEAR